MQLRGFVALSLCAVIGVVSPVLAASKITTTSMQTSDTASAQVPKKVKKGAKVAKALTPEEKRALEKQKLADAAKAKVEKAKADAAKKLADKKKAMEAEKLAKAKADAAKKAADAKALELKKIAKAKAEQDRLAAKAKAEQERLAAKAKADAARMAAAAAKAKAAEQARLARLKAIDDAKQAKIRAAEAARQAEVAQLTSMDVAKSGNNGELRSEADVVPRNTGFLGLFGARPQKVAMLTETRALDAVLEQRDTKKKFKVKPEYEPQTVDYPGYQSGTIVIDTAARRLYLIQSGGTARRYAIAVGREGLQFHGTVAVGDKQEWPRWIPTIDMQKREPKHYAQYKDGMPGGPNNPLGARAIYLYDGKKDTHLRIHGTTQPESIGTSASNGCFRMINEHVQDLYNRVKIGTQVIIL